MISGVIDRKVISTFAEFMICPSGFAQAEASSLPDVVARLGSKAFEEYPFSHSTQRYRGDSEPDEKILLDKLKIVLAAKMATSDRRPLLLLSDGKDSMALALALSKLDIRCKTLTFLRRHDSNLQSYLSGVSRKLGHEPHFVGIDLIQSVYDHDFFLRACSRMSSPVLDQGFLFFLFGCKSFFELNDLEPAEYLLIDGLGNDEHFGYLPSINQWRAYRLSFLNLWRFRPRSATHLRWYLRSPAEAQGLLSALAAFFPFGNSFDLNIFFSDLNANMEPLSFVDYRAFVRGSFMDHQCMMGKTRVAASSLGLESFFPWVDPNLSDFCFNLPISAKLDFANRENKVLLRKLLKTELDWEQQKRGVDLFFDLNFDWFLRQGIQDFSTNDLVSTVGQAWLPDAVKKRAILELNNFLGYCFANKLSVLDAEDILKGR